MTLREQLIDKTQICEGIQALVNQMWKKYDVEWRQVECLRREIIKAERLLAKCPWIVSLKSNPREASFDLIAVEYWEQFPEICNLLKPSNHDSYYLGIEDKYDIQLWFSDGRLSLQFDTDEIAYQFIKEYGIEVNTESLLENRDRAVQAANQMQTITNKILEQL
jgi:hypothetical protein